jgi:CBS domain-containing protein
MICPSCKHENILGSDACEECGQTLTQLAEPGSPMERSITRHPVGVLARKSPIMVASSVTVRSALDTLVENSIGCLLIEENGRVVGIFTERDVLNRVLPDRGRLDEPVSSVMTAAPETIRIDDSIAYAMHEMTVGGYRHLPIAGTDGSAAGVISARDVVRFLSIRYADLRG